MALFTPPLPASTKWHLPGAVWAVLPVAAVLLALMLAGLIGKGAALLLLLGCGLGIWFGQRHWARQIDLLARHAENLGEAAVETGTPPLDADLQAVMDTLRRRVTGERARLDGRSSAAAAMLDALSDPVLLLGGDRRVMRANLAASEVLGRQIVGEDLALMLRHPSVLEAVSEVVEGRATTRELEFELPLAPRRMFAARVMALPRSANDPAAAVLSLHDLTALKRAEQMRADFVANASHELRTPLATLIGFIETLQGPARGDADAHVGFLAIMSDQAARMARLIRDLLGLSQIELNEHTLPRERIDLAPVISGVVDMLQIEAGKAGVTITSDVPADLPPVLGDADELTQVFQNLVDNAIKYGGRDSTVTVAARAVSVRGGGPAGVSISVRDHGPGIAREHLPRLTERFYRVDSARSRALGGTGLGLAIVKHIVNRHRGALTIDSEPGRGSTFTVHLPAHEPRT